MFDRWHRSVEQTSDLDLIPVMNLFVVLIPFLLMGAAFVHVAVVPASLPTHTPSESDVPDTPVAVTLNVVVREDTIEVSASSSSLDPTALEDLAASFPNRDDGYDTDAFQAHLLGIKERYPESNTLVVLPHRDLEYQALVGVLDAARDVETEGLDDEGAPLRRELFPVAVFSRLIESGEEAESIEVDSP